MLRDKRCIFCGGNEPATQIDHVPPKIIFANKLRPRGLEFPSCPRCNQGTRDYDQIIGFMSRVTLSSTPTHERSDIGKLVRAFRNNYPKVIGDIEFRRLGSLTRKRTQRQFPDAASTGIVTGPIIGAIISKFGAKLGFALHYLHTNRIVPEIGGAAVWLLTNEMLVSGGFPSALINAFPDFKSLRQGKNTAIEQFGYSSVDFDAASTAHVVYFRLSFLLLIYVAECDADARVGQLSCDPSELHRPGSWQIPYCLK